MGVFVSATKCMVYYQSMAHTLDPKRNSRNAGFTPLELVVSLAIIILISAQVIIGFSGIGQGVTLNRASQEIVGEIRKAQYASLAVTYANVPVSGIPTFIIPPAVGVRLDTANPQQIIRFADRGTIDPSKPDPDFPSPPDGTCTNTFPLCKDERIGTYTFPVGVKINKITDQNNVSYPIMHILFRTPEATLTITDNTGTAIPGITRADVELITGAGTKKTITVWITGEINVK